MSITNREAIIYLTAELEGTEKCIRSAREARALRVLQNSADAFRMAIAALREKEEREKPPLTLGDQVRRMDDNSLAWQFASLMVGGAGGVMEGLGMTPNTEQMMAKAYPKMLDEVKKPVSSKEA